MIGTALRRTGQTAFNPGVITWHAAFWADDPSWSNPGDGNAVSSWRDYSGNSRTATQADGTRQPIFRTSTTNLNNRASVDFDGVNDFLLASGWGAISQPLSVVAVVDWKGGTGANDLILFLSTTGNLQLIRNDGAAQWRISPGTTGFGSVTSVAGAHAFVGLFNNTSSAIGVDSNAVATGGAGSATYDEVAIGASHSSTSAGDYRIAFVGVYTGGTGDVRSDANWSTFKAAMNTYYGTNLA